MLVAVGLELGQKLGVVRRLAQVPHDEDARQTGEEVVVAEAAGVVVEDEEEHQRHDVHHVLHHLHLLRLIARHRVLLLTHGDPRVDDVRQAEEQAEDGEVVADEPEVGVPAEQFVVAREVVGPEETLAAQLDAVGHEVEERNPDGHLDEHRQTAAHGRNAVLRIELHHLLLLLHGVLLAGIFLGELVNLGLEHTHLGRREITLLRGGIDQNLDDDGQEEQHHTHRQTPRGEPVEKRHDDPAVDPLEERPAQIDQVLELGRLPGEGQLVVGLEDVEVVGTHVHLQARLPRPAAVEGHRKSGVVLLEVARALLLGRGVQRGLGEAVGRQQHAGEELILESHPCQRLVGRLGLLLRLVEVVGVAVRLAERERGVALLEVEALLLLRGHAVPLDEELVGTRLQQRREAAGRERDVDHVALGQELVVNVEMTLLGAQTHRGGAARVAQDAEGVLLRVDVLALARKEEGELAAVGTQDGNGAALTVLVAQEAGTLDGAALRVEHQLHKAVGEHEATALSGALVEEERIGIRGSLCGKLCGTGLFGLGLSAAHLLLDLSDGVLLAGQLGGLLGRGLAVPGEADEHHGDENESGNGVFIHNIRCFQKMLHNSADKGTK